MAGSRFGRRYDKEKLTEPLIVDEEVLKALAHAVGSQSGPAQAYRLLTSRKARGEDVVCLLDDRDLFVVDHAELPEFLKRRPV